MEKMLSILDNVVKVPFKGHYAIFKGMSYGCDYEIIYFEWKGKEYYDIKENDLDSRSRSELIKVIERFDKKEQQYFDSEMFYCFFVIFVWFIYE